MVSWTQKLEVKLLDSDIVEDGYHKAGDFLKQRNHILNSQKTGNDKYSKKNKGHMF